MKLQEIEKGQVFETTHTQTHKENMLEVRHASFP